MDNSVMKAEAMGCSRRVVDELLESIAEMETSLGLILSAEAEKLKKALTLEGLDLCKLLEINDSAANMVHAAANLELVLKDKLELVATTLYYPGDEPEAPEQAL